MSSYMGCYKKKHVFEDIVDKYIHYNIEWLMNISKEQRELLKNYLLNIDKTYRVDPDSERSRVVRQGVRDIVEKIAELIAERKPELKGDIIPRGSSHNGTKIGDSDEFDFVYQIDMDNFLKGLGTFKGLCDRIVCVDIIPKPTVCFPASKPSDYVLKKYFCKEFTGEQWFLNTFKIKLLFRKVLNEVLSELELPPCWCHGGFNRPHFSGLRFLGPSHVLQFDYLAASDTIPLRISVDFVPMVKCQPISQLPEPNPLQACLKDETFLQYGWYSLHQKNNSSLGENYFGHAEELWLSKFPTQSTVKTAIRIFKVLHRLVKASATKYPSQSDMSKIDSYVKNTTTEMGRSCNLQLFVHKRDGFVYAQDDFISYSDLNETTGDDCIIKSYFIKLLVLNIMFADKESQGREWTDDDLPDLVISVYMFLHESIIRLRLHSPESITGISSSEHDYDKVFKEELSIPLKEIEEQTEDKLWLPSQGEDIFHNYKENISELLEHIKSGDNYLISHRSSKGPLITLPDTPKLYHLLNNSPLKEDAIGRIEPSLIAHSQIAAIFQLLRAVCEGRSSVDIVTLGSKIFDNSDLVRKTDFKELLYTLNCPTLEFQKLKSVE